MTISTPATSTLTRDDALDLFDQAVDLQVAAMRRMVANYDRGLLAPIDVLTAIRSANANVDNALALLETTLP